MDDVIVAGAQALSRGGQWRQAVALLETVADEPTRRRAVADVLADRGFWSGDLAAEAAMTLIADDESWPARMVRARVEFGRQLGALPAGGQPSGAELEEGLQRLAVEAPDATSAAQAQLYLGLTAEVLRGDVTTAASHYESVLETAEPYLRAYALRHLGGHALDAGDPDRARTLWLESLRLRMRCGHVPGALAQVILLRDVIAVDELVDEWADQLGAETLRGMR